VYPVKNSVSLGVRFVSDLIDKYIATQFHPDLGMELQRSFRLFEDFGLEDFESDFDSILMQEAVLMTEETRSWFLNTFHEKLDSIFNQCSISLMVDIDIYHKNEILFALDTVQHLLDYQDILPLLEADLPNEEILASILFLYCELSQETLLDSIQSVKSILITTMKRYFNDKDSNRSMLPNESDMLKELINVNKMFYLYNKSIETIGSRLIMAETLLDRSIDEYLSIAGDIDVKRPIKDIALDVYSILLLTYDGYVETLLSYRKNSHLFFGSNDVSFIQKVDIELTRQIQLFSSFISDERMKERQTQSPTYH